MARSGGWWRFVVMLCIMLGMKKEDKVMAQTVVACQEYTPVAAGTQYIMNADLTWTSDTNSCMGFTGDETVDGTVVDGQGHNIICSGDCTDQAAIYYRGTASITFKNINFIGNFKFGILVFETDMFVGITVESCTFSTIYGVVSVADSTGSYVVSNSIFNDILFGVYTEANNNLIQVTNSQFNINEGFCVCIANGTTSQLHVQASTFTMCNYSVFTQMPTNEVIVDGCQFTHTLIGVDGNDDSLISSLNVTNSIFISNEVGVYYSNPGNSVTIDSNQFYDIGFAATTFNATTVEITNNFVSGRIQTEPETIVAFQSGRGTNSALVTNNSIYNHCLGIFFGNIAMVRDNYISGCNYTGITVFGDETLGTYQVINNTVENGFGKINYNDVVDGHYPTGIYVSGDSDTPLGTAMVTDNVVQRNTVACNATFWGIYIARFNDFQIENNKVIGIVQENSGSTCGDSPFTIGIGIEALGTGIICNCIINNIDSSLPSFYQSASKIEYRTVGLRVYDTTSVILFNVSISNIKANPAPACTGCLYNDGDVAIALMIWGNTKPTNATLIGVNINSIYGGNGGTILSPVPPNAESIGADAAAVLGNINSSISITSLTIQNVIGGNGALFGGANYSTCAGGHAYDILVSHPLSIPIGGLFTNNVNDGQACITTMQVTKCGYYSDLPDGFVLSLAADIVQTTPSNHCIYVENSKNFRFAGNGYAISCSNPTACASYAGIYVRSSLTVTVADLTVKGWMAADVMIFNVTGVIATNNFFGESNYGIAEAPDNQIHPSSYQILSNSFQSCNPSAPIQGGSFTIRNNTLYNPNNSSYGFTVTATGNVEFSGNRATNATLGNFIANSGNFAENSVQGASGTGLMITNNGGAMSITGNTIQYVDQTNSYPQGGGILLTCGAQSSTTLIADNIIRDSPVGCEILSFGIQIAGCFNVESRNNTVANFYTPVTSCVPPTMTGLLINKGNNITITTMHIDGIQNLVSATLPRSTYEYLPPTMGLYFLQTNASISSSTINNIRGPNGQSCSYCNASGYSAGALTIEADSGQMLLPSSIIVSGLTITNVYGGNGGDIVDVTKATNQTSFGGDAVGFYVIGSGTISYSSVTAQYFYGGNGGKIPGGDATVCRGGQASIYLSYLSSPPFDVSQISASDFSGGFACGTAPATTSTTSGTSTTGTIVVPPSAPLSFTITNVTRFTVIATWQSPQLGAPISFYSLEVRQNNIWTAKHNGTALSATITGLLANTSYDFRVAAYNKAGKGDYSNILSATTLPLAAPTQTGNVTLLENSRSSLVVTWTRPVDDGGVTNTFWVRFAQGGNFTNFTTNSVTNNKYGAYGLNINSTYSFSVRSCNTIGCSNYTAFASYSTLPVTCADGFCDTNENCSTCPSDCGPCVYPACPGLSQCSGNGECFQGICNCGIGFTGSDCSIPDSSSLPVVISVTQPDNTTTTNSTAIIPPAVNIGVTKDDGEKLSFGIEFENIQEVDPYGNVVVTVPLNIHNFTIVGHSVVLGNTTAFGYNYSTVLPNQAIVNITVFSVTTSTFVSFANHTIKIGENGVKYAMRVENWPFNSIKNVLHINARSSSSSSSSSQPCQDAFANDDSNLQWLKVFINGVTLYGSFQDYAILDDVIRNISFSFDSVNSLVTVNVPFFWMAAEFDPNFQVLFDTQTTSQVICDSNAKKSKNISGKIAGAVVGSVVGVALLVAAGMYIHLSLKKRQTMKLMRSN